MSKIQKTITNLEDLDTKYEKIIEEKHEIDEEKIHILRDKCVDLFIPLKSRIQFLIKFYNYCLTNIDYGFGEIISRITGMYFFSKTKNLEEYIHNICQTREIGLSYRIECSKTLEEKGHKYINSIFQNEKDQVKTLSIPVRIDTVIFLMKSEDFKEQSREYFCDIINDSSIEEIYRYKTIQKLESIFEASKTSIPLRIQKKKKIEISDKNIQKFIFYAKESCIRFVKNTKNSFTYRTLACQYLFEKCNVDGDLSNFLEEFLLSIANDPTIDEDIRADSADICLRYGSEQSRDMAMSIIIVLGGEDNHNIFKNKQNVHNIHIEKSIQEIVDKLCAYHPVNKKFYDFNEIKDSINKLLSDDEKETKEKIEGSLTRISLDRAVYGSSNMSLLNILSKVWTYIQNSPFKEDLEKRLIEELCDSYNKCSTGFCGRLVNTLSGYDESMTIIMSFEDQIYANMESRLTSKIREIECEEYMEKVLNEMTIPVIHYHKRLNFLRFFRQHISKIRQNLYEEFHTYITDEDFDLYIRKSIIRWEGCN